MKLTVTIETKLPTKLDALVVFERHPLPASIATEAQRQWERGPVAVIPTLGQMPVALVVALKRPEPRDPRAVMRRFGAAARCLLRERALKAAIVVPKELPQSAALAAILGLSRGLYRFDRYKTVEPTPLPAVTVVAPGSAWRNAAQNALLVAEGTALCRDLINTPAEDMGPAELEQAARRVAKQAGLGIKVYDAKACADLGMGALIAVGRASARQPRMIVLEHRAGKRQDTLALVGKGICFDTGGLDLKSSEGMLLMKKDMGGAATVLGAAWAVGKARPKRNVRFYLAVAENAVSGNAFRPGDIVRAMDGTTIEVGNTDAEGRLVLADALCLARRDGATRIVDAATLTGAALIALGRVRVPLLGNDETLLRAIEEAAATTGEKVWRMPSDDEYKEQIKGKLADLKNVGKGSEAGVMAGGLFIGHFAGAIPWAHLDISPASWADAEHDLGPDGATGVMVATLARLAGAC